MAHMLIRIIELSQGFYQKLFKKCYMPQSLCQNQEANPRNIR